MKTIIALIILALVTPMTAQNTKQDTSISMSLQDAEEGYIYAVRVIVTGMDPTRKLTLKWEASSNAKAYAVERSTNDKEFEKLGEVTATTYVETGLQPGRYLYRVAAIR